MHVLEDDDDLGTVKSNKSATHPSDFFENIEKLSVLHIVHQNVKVATVLSNSLHLAEEPIVHL